jgi:hypothetical protein
VIIHVFEEWGIGCIDKFRGMFAFAIRDRILDVKDVVLMLSGESFKIVQNMKNIFRKITFEYRISVS